jgi:hypothetical protein
MNAVKVPLEEFQRHSNFKTGRMLLKWRWRCSSGTQAAEGSIIE